MGRMAGLRQISLYVDPLLYEKVRCAAYALGEDIYVFISEAMKNSVERRLTPSQVNAVEQMASQNFKNLKSKKTREKR